MARMQFNSENVKSQHTKLNRLKLDTGERARIVLMEEEPVVEYIHNIQMPEVQNGNVVMTNYTRKDGSVNEDYSYEWVGTQLCLGDFDVVSDAGTDGENCPLCKEAETGDQVQAPRRKFAINILRYATKADSYETRSPFKVEALAWTFSDGMYGTLVELKNEYGDLKKKDLNLKCKVKQFQQYDIQVAAECQWLQEDNRAAAVEEYEGNKYSDEELTGGCGFSAKAERMRGDIRKIKSRWEEVRRIESGETAKPLSDSQVDASLDNLLDDVASDAQVNEDQADTPSSDDKPGTGDSVNLDDFLKDL